jgi:hypothetical protein
VPAPKPGFSRAVTVELLDDSADLAGIDLVRIDQGTNRRRFQPELPGNEADSGFAADGFP